MHNVFITKKSQKSNCLRWKWLTHICNAMTECGMDHIFQNNMFSDYWIHKFRSVV